MSEQSDRPLDLICLGRAGVDLYAQQIGSRLEDVASFAKYIGGSSTNIAACSSRMGLKTALISRVGDEHMGRFLREQLVREGVDVTHVVTDPTRPTAMVLLGIKDRDTFPLVFVRENCADMAVDAADFDADFIGSARALVITGTHFSTDQVYATSLAALNLAAEQGVKRVLDIDYRPVLWGLTSRGDGETRFIADDGITAHLQGILPLFDLIVGTEEEIHIAGGSTDTVTALRAIRAVSDAGIVLKRGPYGASVYSGAIPDSLDEGITVEGVSVDVLNVLGAGDAFVSGFLRGWLNSEGFEQALRYANACGALVVSRHGCTPAMPTVEELDHYLKNSDSIPRPDVDPELNYLHRVTTRSSDWGEREFCIHAFDHRIQFVELAREVGTDLARLPCLKTLLLQATQQVALELSDYNVGILCDDSFGQDVLNAATGEGWWIGRPVEQPKSRPIEFEGGGSIGTRLQQWPTEQVVKLLVFYHPDDEPELRALQERRVQELYRACCASGHEFLLELIPPACSRDWDEAVPRAVERFYNLDVRPDWWKLPALAKPTLQRIGALIDQRAPHCHGILILGLDAPINDFVDAFRHCAGVQQVRGFAVGRSIFSEPSRAWLSGKIDDATLVQHTAENFRMVIQAWRNRAS